MAGLLLRAMRWRLGASLAVLVVGAVAATAAALGPLYARSAEESLVLERLAGAVADNRIVELDATTVGQPADPGGPAPPSASQLDVAMTTELAAAHALDRWFGSAASWIVLPLGALSDARGGSLGSARSSWHSGTCAGVRLLAGRCIADAQDVVVSARLLAAAHLRIGDPLVLDLPGPLGGSKRYRLAVVGSYALGSARPEVWGSRPPVQLYEPREGPGQLDEILLSEPLVRGARTAEARTSTFRTVRADVDTLDEADAAGAAAADTAAGLVRTESAALVANQGQPVWSVRTGLPALLQELRADRDQLRLTSVAVAAQLVLLSWFVLFLVVSATTEERSGELALAKLRGLGAWRTLRFGVVETAVLLAAAVPLGLLAAVAVDALLVRAVPLPRTGVRIDRLTLAAAAVGLFGALVAAVLALRRILTAPVLDQLRRTGGARAALARAFAVDAVALTLAAEGVYLLRRGNGDPVALVAPGLLALAAGLLAVRLLPFLARVAVRRSVASARVASFLAVRNVARRPGGARLVVLLTLATALGVFAASSWTIARDVRADTARQEVAAPTVLHVGAATPATLVALVDRADPGGRWALAAAQYDRASRGSVLGVQTPRLGAVTSWDPAWAGTSFPAIDAALHPAVAAPVLVHDRPAVTARARAVRGSPPVDLAVRVLRPDGVQQSLALGRLQPGVHTYTGRLPDCGGGCRVLGLVLIGEGLGNRYSYGDLLVSRITDERGAVDARLGTGTVWRVVPRAAAPGSDTLDQRSATALGGGLSIRYSGLIANDDVVVEVADHPRLPAALVGSGRELDLVEGSQTDFTDTGLAGDSVVLRRVAGGNLPRVGRQGLLVDLENVAAVETGTWDNVDYQVWLGPGAPASVRQALTAGGAEVTRAETIGGRRDELGRDAASLALRLSLVASAVAVLLALATVLATAYVGGRRRAYELAALRALGARTGVLVRTGRREQLLLVVPGVLVGAAVGLASTAAALPALPAVALTGIAPVPHGPRLLVVAGVVLAALLLVAGVAHLGARRVVAAAGADLLRENQA